MEKILRIEYRKGEEQVFPDHKMVNNWLFNETETEEATLAYAMAKVAEKNNMTANDLIHLFPAVLRMLRSESNWIK